MRWRAISLRARIFLIVSGLVLAAMAGAVVTVAYMHWLASVLTSFMDRDVAALKAAQELETALVMQKGFATYYIQDREREWLRQLDEHRNLFETWLQKARASSQLAEAEGILEQIGSEYGRYDSSRSQVIQWYDAGENEAAAQLHRETRGRFLVIRELCEQYIRVHEKSMESTRAAIAQRAEYINDLAMATAPGVLLLGLLLGWIILRQILGPIREMARESEQRRGAPEGDEVKALSRRVRGLMEDVDQTRSQLELSQEHLFRSEKLALVGKLAAGVAHSIRNPLTSVKMRLFSMQRTLRLADGQREDFEVISEEIRHIDSIVRSFLEFSRPPKLAMQRVSPSDVVDTTFNLLRDRLGSYGVRAEIRREGRLSEIWADPDQLKEVLVNLMVNACEAMGAGGGQIVIREEQAESQGSGRSVILRVEDTGPGIPESIRDKVLQPFFSTKEEGTGLGLSIAARIVEEHGGRLELISRGEGGASFAIALPVKEEGAWARS
jgi:signal transduction histidine kinase